MVALNWIGLLAAALSPTDSSDSLVQYLQTIFLGAQGSFSKIVFIN
jgi:hypothetical protein